MKMPNIFMWCWLDDILSTRKEYPYKDGRMGTYWAPARPEQWDANIFDLEVWRLRIKAAWLVFKGEADIIVWK